MCQSAPRHPLFHVQTEDGHYQAPKHAAVPYVEKTLYSTNKYGCVRPEHTVNCVRPVHTLYTVLDQYTHCKLR